jgi:hypothetical protein
MGYGLDDRGSIPNRGYDGIRHRIQTGSGSNPASYPIGTGGSYLGVKAAGAKNAWSYTSTPSIVLHGLVLD